MYRDVYFDLKVRHFHEKLGEKHGIELSYTWLQQALQGAGLAARGHKRGKHRRRRPRRPLIGMLLHIDGSKHRWSNDERWHDLIVILDDAKHRDLLRAAGGRGIDADGEYSDRGSQFFVMLKAGEKVDKPAFDTLGRAIKELGVQMVSGYSPQARGRSERSFGTWQERRAQELRLAGIMDLAGANRFLREIAEFNTKFAAPAAEKGSAFRRCGRSDLKWIFTVQTEPIVAKDNTIAHWRPKVADRKTASGTRWQDAQ